MIYVPIPLHLLELGQSLPFDVLDPNGTLLMRKGQVIFSEKQKEILRAHNASMTSADARAWKRGFDRMIQNMIRDGAHISSIAKARLPAEILAADYAPVSETRGGWLDLQETLLGFLYQGSAASSPLERLQNIECEAVDLLMSDPDECLFVLFQALPDLTLGYSATHALLAAVVGELTAQKMNMPLADRRILFRSALTMNIGMARAQGTLALQNSTPTEEQRQLIKEHAPKSSQILKLFGIHDENMLDLVQRHHEVDESKGLIHNLESRRILTMADSFIAKMAPRKTRAAMSPLGAAKSLFLGATEKTVKLSSAMTMVTGFYPPGSYVQLSNGETAVAVSRGARANTPQVLSIINADGIAMNRYVPRDTADPNFSILSPVNSEKVKLNLNLEKIRKARNESKG